MASGIAKSGAIALCGDPHVDAPGVAPYVSRAMRTRRKIVSAIGMTEICPVRRAAPGVVEPLPSFGETGLMSAISADGFVIVPETERRSRARCFRACLPI